jgi:nucleoside-diphosphate-sugar epimerase
MHVLVVGPTGFVGPAVIGRLKKKGIDRISCFLRRSSHLGQIETYDIEKAFGDLADTASICDALQGKDALISIASLKYGFCRNLIRACEIMKIKRAVFVSTTGIFTRLEPREKNIVLDAERSISESALDYTIIRPTMIYGDRRDKNMHFLIDYLKGHSYIPIFGSGRCLQQPVYVGDVASAVVESFLTRKTNRKSYNVSGRSAISYNRIIDTICDILGKKIQKIHIPYHVSLVLVAAVQIIQRNSRFTVGQVRRLNEDKIFDYAMAREDFGYDPISFEEGIRMEIAALS